MKKLISMTLLISSFFLLPITTHAYTRIQVATDDEYNAVEAKLENNEKSPLLTASSIIKMASVSSLTLLFPISSKGRP